MSSRACLHVLFTIVAVVLLPSCRENHGSVEPATAAAEPSADTLAKDADSGAAKPSVRRVTDPYPVVGPFPFPPAPEVTDAGFESLDEMMWTLVKAIDAGDVDLLRDYLVEEDFYLERLFPEFVAEKPSLEGRGQFHWDHLEMKSLSGILDLKRIYSGKGLEFRLFVPESVKEYRTFKLHRQPTVMCFDPAAGSVVPFTYKLINDVVEFDGKFKLLAYPN